MTTEQWIKDHDDSLGIATPEAAFMRMSDDELVEIILDRRKGMVTMAREERSRRLSCRVHTSLKAAQKAYRDAIKAYTDNTCDNPLYGASAEARTMGMA